MVVYFFFLFLKDIYYIYNLKGGGFMTLCNVCKDSKMLTREVKAYGGVCKEVVPCPYCKDKEVPNVAPKS